MTARGFLKTKYGNKPLGEIVANMTALQVEAAMEEYAEMVAKNCTIPHVVRRSDPLFCPKCNSTQRINNDNDDKYTCSRCGTRWAK